MQISKFDSDAKIVERWGASHEVGFLQQIGAMEPVAHLDEPLVLSAPTSTGTILMSLWARSQDAAEV